MVALLLVAGAGVVSAEPAKARIARLEALRDRLRPLHVPLAAPQPGEWRDKHPEPGQSFAQYLKSKPATVSRQRHVLYVQPLGEFSERQRDVVKLAADYLGRYTQLSVKMLPDISAANFPPRARRKSPLTGDQQILSSYVLSDVLPPLLPQDGASILAFASSDLWPGEGWNFVFGQASIQNRVGVWSLFRYGDPAASKDAFRKCLARTIKVATHETGHMFSLRHCTAYRCNMNGSNSLAESDRQPLELCPECIAKLCWATGADPRKRIEQLAEFSRENRLEEVEEFYRKSLDALADTSPAK